MWVNPGENSDSPGPVTEKHLCWGRLIPSEGVVASNTKGFQRDLEGRISHQCPSLTMRDHRGQKI